MVLVTNEDILSNILLNGTVRSLNKANECATVKSLNKATRLVVSRGQLCFSHSKTDQIAESSE